MQIVRIPEDAGKSDVGGEWLVSVHSGCLHPECVHTC